MITHIYIINLHKPSSTFINPYQPFFMRLLFTVTNDLTYDQRMQRICTSLAAQGYTVELVGRELPQSLPLVQQTFGQKRLRCRFRKGFAFYAEYNLRLFAYLLTARYDAVCSIDLDTLAAGCCATLLRRKKRVFDAHEYFTEVPEVLHRPLVRAFWGGVARCCLPFYRHAYTVGPALAGILGKKYGLQFEVVRNTPWGALGAPVEKPPPRPPVKGGSHIEREKDADSSLDPTASEHTHQRPSAAEWGQSPPFTGGLGGASSTEHSATNPLKQATKLNDLVTDTESTAVPTAPPRRPVKGGSHIERENDADSSLDPTASEHTNQRPSAAEWGQSPPFTGGLGGGPPTSDAVVILYQGALNAGRGLEAAIAAMQQLDNVQLWLAGEGDLSAALRRLAAQLGVQDKVRFLGFVRPEDLIALTAQAWLGLNLLENLGQSYYYSLANKFFDYVQAEVPVLTMNFPEYRALNAEHEVALLLDELSPDRVAAAIRLLRDDEALYARLQDSCTSARRVWTWEEDEKVLLEVWAAVRN